jgi:hypothetical protein
MAQRTQIIITDDIDGSEAEGTIRFSFGGTSYEIDLNKKHADQFATALAPFTAAGRKVSGTRRSSRDGQASRHDQSGVRVWAREQGLKVSDRGRIPADVIAKYEAAH